MLSVFIAGVIFGSGLALSQMTDPERVIGFLDIAGRWDPTLLLVMAGALAVTVPLFPLVLRRERALNGDKFRLPIKTTIDPPLVLGAAIFGIGWGIAGLCPGAAVAALSTGSPAVIVFVGAMITGQWFAGRFDR
jgi:uncharacterized membrane protein YedE/YeeE